MEAVKKVGNKRWLYIIPACFLTTLFAAMDRNIISLALPGGMSQELELNATFAGFASGILAIGFLFLQVPGGQLAQRGQAKNLVAACIFSWSLFSFLTAFTSSPVLLYTLRFLVGFAEGALSPAVVTLLTFWFPDKDGERNRANSAYYSAYSVAGVIMGPLGGAIISVWGWRSLFAILGVVSFLTLIVWMVCIKERPETAKWLDEAEKDYITTTIREERELVKQVTNAQEATSEKLNLTALLRNKYVLILTIVSICVNIGQYGFVMWLPTMIKNIVKTNMLGVGLLTALPNICCLVGLWFWSPIAKNVKDRRLTTAIPLLVFAISLISLTLAPADNVKLNLAAMCFAGFCIQGHMASFFTIPSLVLVKEQDGPARGLIGLGSGIGAFLGPYLVGLLITNLGSINAGMYCIAATLVVGFAVCFWLPKNLGARPEAAASASSGSAGK